MSVQYGHYLVPVDSRYVPREEAVLKLLHGLASDGWIDTRAAARRTRFLEGSQRERTKLHGFAEIARDILECVEGGLHQNINLQPKELTSEADTEDERVFWQMPKGTSLSQHWCWGVSVSVSADLRLVPMGEIPGVLLCPLCRSDLAGQLGKEETPAVELLLECNACREKIDLNAVERIADAAVTDCPQISELAPFFRFHLCLTSDSPPEDPAVTDPTILELLRSSTGVEFRALGRWF